MLVDNKKLMQILKKRELPPLLLLHGDEDYFIDEFVHYIETELLTQGEKSFNQSVYYGRDTEAEALINEAQRYPLMAPYQVIIIKEAQDMRTLPKLERYVQAPVSTTFLVIAYKQKKFDKRTRLYKLFKDKGAILESNRVKENSLTAWIIQRAAHYSLRISSEAIELLLTYVGSNLQILDNALSKLSLNADEGEEVTIDDVSHQVGISRDYNVFELQKALGRRDVQKTASITKYLSEHTKEHSPPMILAMLYSYFSKTTALYYASNSTQKMKDIGIGQWNMEDYVQGAKNYNKQLPQVINLLQQFDLASKSIDTPAIEDGMLLRELVVKILYV